MLSCSSPKAICSTGSKYSSTCTLLSIHHSNKDRVYCFFIPRAHVHIKLLYGSGRFLGIANIFPLPYKSLEDTERLLSGLGTLRLVSQDIETNRLGKGTALSNGDNVSILDRVKGRRAVGSNVLVSLLKTTVLLDVVQVVSSDNDRSLHLCGHYLSLENSSADGNISSKGALFVDVASFNSRIRGLDSKPNVLDESHGLLAGSLDTAFPGYEDGILLLVSLFVLITLDVFLWNSSHFELSNKT